MSRNGIRKITAITPNQILFDAQNFVAVGAVIGQGSVSAGEDGRKVIKAGTPVSGDLMNRNTAFSVSQKDDENIVGVLLHDVDVTEGDENGTVLIFGFVDMNKLDSSVAELLNTVNTDTSKIFENVGKVTFLK